MESMCIGRLRRKNRRMRNLFIIMVCVSSCLLTGCGAEKEEESAKTQEEIAGKFEFYNRMLGWDGEESHMADDTSGANSYDIREIAGQVEGFWEYHENYERELEKLRTVIAGWEADFIPEGTYEVGVDLTPGYYVICNSDLEPGELVSYGTEGTEAENGIKHDTNGDVSSWDLTFYYDAFFRIFGLKEGDAVYVKGHPKFAPFEDFPVLTPAEDGNYYGFDKLYLYEVGKDLSPGKYFVLSMDTKSGELDYLDDITKAEYYLYAKNRFSYVFLKDGDIFSMDKCVLIPIEQKPAIFPNPHEDISYQNEESTLTDVVLEHFFPKEKSGEQYEMPVYVEGEYIIGEDIPLGTYRIQNEVTASVNDVEETALHSDFEMAYDYSWTGLRLLDVWEAGDAEWSFIRTGLYGEYAQIKKTDGTSEYLQMAPGSLPEVTFDESDAGYVVRVVRCILIPSE